MPIVSYFLFFSLHKFLDTVFIFGTNTFVIKTHSIFSSEKVYERFTYIFLFIWFHKIFGNTFSLRNTLCSHVVPLVHTRWYLRR